jgi:hypothetical protein
VDEGIELMTGFVAGSRDSSGSFAKESVNRKVEDRLLEFAELRRRYGASAVGKDEAHA